jgi:regulator of sirC expression with transglutaminase-like and TPR domain
VAALQIAAIEYPNVEVAGFQELLDSHARELRQWMRPNMGGEEWVELANRYLFEHLGFAGNQEDYYNPANSCLNQVLLERKGIPITLAVVYLEVARRLHRPVVGISLPGHFLVKYEDDDYAAFIDCFHGGRAVSLEECRDLALRLANVDILTNRAVLKPATNRQIALRMLNNLRGAYYRSRQLEKVVAVLDLLILADPQSAEEYKQRGVVQMALERPQKALPDLERYLELAPHAADRAGIEGHIRELRRLVR